MTNTDLTDFQYEDEFPETTHKREGSVPDTLIRALESGRAISLPFPEGEDAEGGNRLAMRIRSACQKRGNFNISQRVKPAEGKVYLQRYDG